MDEMETEAKTAIAQPLDSAPQDVSSSAAQGSSSLEADPAITADSSSQSVPPPPSSETSPASSGPDADGPSVNAGDATALDNSGNGNGSSSAVFTVDTSVALFLLAQSFQVFDRCVVRRLFACLFVVLFIQPLCISINVALRGSEFRFRFQ